MISVDILTQKHYESDPKLKTKEIDIQLARKLISIAIWTPEIIVSNLS